MNTRTMNTQCKLSARVVRRDKKGVGVSFENITGEQKKIILDLSGTDFHDLLQDTEQPIHVQHEVAGRKM